MNMLFSSFFYFLLLHLILLLLLTTLSAVYEGCYKHFVDSLPFFFSIFFLTLLLCQQTAEIQNLELSIFFYIVLILGLQ